MSALTQLTDLNCTMTIYSKRAEINNYRAVKGFMRFFAYFAMGLCNFYPVTTNSMVLCILRILSKQCKFSLDFKGHYYTFKQSMPGRNNS